MQTLEYRTRDKSEWEPGPWIDEPDKRQWQDKATGLPCLIVRGPVGALCGFVGVPTGHPLHGKDYRDRIPVPDRSKVLIGENPSVIALLIESSKDDDGCCSIDVLMNVHGGVTFAGGCHKPTRTAWESWRQHMIDRKVEAAEFPHGDMARAWKEKGKFVDDFDGWCEHMAKSAICHAPGEGEPDDVWWFGFDCAHSGDDWSFSQPSRFRYRDRDGTYKDIEYVTGQCDSLAQQLAAMK